MPERSFRVRGQVQGVGFRWWTRSHARDLGLTGSVRNVEDGSVEIRASGSEEALDSLRVLLRRGPPHARVTSVDEEEAPVPDGDSFEIAH